MPATAATDNTLWRRLKKALWSSSSSRTILFSSVVASKEDDDEFVGKCIVRFPPPFRERHRRDNVGGLEEENDKKTVVVILGVSLLSLFYRRLLRRVLRGVLLWATTTTFRSRGYRALTLSGQTTRKKSEVFRQKEHSVSIPFVHAFAAREEAEDISAFCCFFFRRFAEEYWCTNYSAHKRARSIGYSTTRSWNTITRARNASFDYIRARIFRRRRQRNREKEVLSGNGTFQRVSNQKRLSVSDISSRGNICFLCAREDRERRDNRRSALRNTSRYQKRI